MTSPTSLINPNTTPWQAIVFDLDDTLYAERDFVLSGFRAVAAWAEIQIGVPAGECYAELQQLFAEGERGHTFDLWLSAHDLAPEQWSGQFVQVYRSHQPTIKPFPQVPNLLADLHAHHRLGLVSDGYLAVQRRKLEALQISTHFDAVVFSDEWGRSAWKPHPQPFRAVSERLNIEPAGCVYVADNPLKDFIGARRAGFQSVWLRQPGGEYSHVDPPTADHQPDVTVDSIQALQHLLSNRKGDSPC